MFYKPERDSNGKPYYVPIVVKNKDYLIGYIQGIRDGKDFMTDILNYLNIDLDVNSIKTDFILDSTRFNDILSNGKRENEMSEEELKEYFYDMIENVVSNTFYENSENNIESDYIFDVECTCGLGYYAWKDYNDLPDETFKCVNCGKTLIHYTGEYCHNLEYDYTGGEFDG